MIHSAWHLADRTGEPAINPEVSFMAATVERSNAASQARPRSTDAREGKHAERLTGGRRALRLGGALALLAMGALHLQQFIGAEYSAIATIGTLFVLNFAGSVVVALGLIAPTERLAGRLGGAAVTLLALGGLAMAAAAIVFLLISESTPIFGFMETGYRTPIVVALISEGLAVLLLGAYLASGLRAARSRPSG
jgi:hypothetical protein